MKDTEMMIIKQSVPNVTIIQNGEWVYDINTMIYLDEDKHTLTLCCAEYIPFFKRGYVCDIVQNFALFKSDDIKQDPVKFEALCTKDMVLVYINKSYEVTDIPRFYYVFYK